MNRIFHAFILLASLLVAIPASAQYTNVTATVKDPYGNLYVNCLYNVDYVDQSGQSILPNLYGSTFQQSFSGARCDGAATLAIRLADNNQVTPTPSKWRFSICSSDQLRCFIVLITITGFNQDVTAQIQAAAMILSTPTTGGGIVYPNLITGGADMCGKTNIGILAAPSGTGYISDLGFTGAQSCASNMLDSVSTTGKIIFNTSLISTTATQQFPISTSALPANWELQGIFGGYFGGTQSQTGTIFKWAGATSTPVFKLYGTQRAQMSDFNIDCSSTSGATGMLWHTDGTVSQGANIHDFSTLNCPLGIQVGDSGSSSAGQADRVYVNNYHIGAPAIQNTAVAVRVNSTNALQTSEFTNGEIVNVHGGFDLQEQSSGLLTVRDLQSNIQGGTDSDFAYLFKLSNVKDVKIEKTQIEGSQCNPGDCYHTWITGSPANSAQILMVQNNFGYPVKVDRTVVIVSLANYGNMPGIVYAAGARVYSTGDHMGNTLTSFHNWIVPSWTLGSLSRTTNVVTVTMPSCTISNLTRAGGGLVTVVCTAAHGLSEGQPFNISGTATDSGSFNGTFIVGQVVNSTTATFFQFGQGTVGSVAASGTLQAYVGFPDQMTVNISSTTDATYASNGAVITLDGTSPNFKFSYTKAGGNGSTTGGTINSRGQVFTDFLENSTADVYPVTFNSGNIISPIATFTNNVSNTGISLKNVATGGKEWRIITSGTSDQETPLISNGSIAFQDVTDSTIPFTVTSGGQGLFLNGVSLCAACNQTPITIPNSTSYYGLNATGTAIPLVSIDNTNTEHIGLGASVSAISLGQNTTVAAGKTLTIGNGGTPIAKYIEGTVTQDVASIAANTCADTNTISVTGAVDGDATTVGVPASLASNAGLQFSAYVSAADTAKVHICNVTVGAIDPPSTTYRVGVWVH